MGGTDEPSNIVELSIEEHAEAHRLLYEKHGYWQDMLAWKGLLGLITSNECTFLSIKEGGKNGAKIGNMRRWGVHVKFRDDPDFIPYHKRQSGYSKDVDGRKVRLKRYWFNNGVKEGQFSLEDYPDNWVRGRLRSVMNKTNPNVSL